MAMPRSTLFWGDIDENWAADSEEDIDPGAANQA